MPRSSSCKARPRSNSPSPMTEVCHIFPEWLYRWPKTCRALTRKRIRRSALEYLEQRTLLSTVRTIVYDQITSLASSNPLNADAPYNLLDANGNRAVFSTNISGVTKVYTINSDGSDQTLVDANGSATLDLSADGSVILETIGHGDAGTEYRIVNADGSNMHDAFETGTLEEFDNGRLSADGSTVFFTADAPFPIAGQSQPDQPGLYAVAASGASQPQLIVSQANVAALLGSSVGAVDMGNSAGDLALGSSSDGSRLVFSAGTANVGSVELGVNRDGSGLHLIRPINPANAVVVEAAGISGDGSKVFVFDSTIADGHPTTLTVYNFDGSDPVLLSNLNDFGVDNGAEHFELTQDGSKLLFGTTSMLINTDNSGVVQIGTDAPASTIAAHNATLYHATMNSSGTEFLYTMSDVNHAQQLAIATLNPASLGVDPAISNVTINPPYIVIPPGSPTATTISAQVSPTAVRDVSDALLYNGVSSNGLVVNGNTVDYFADQQLFDDGSHGDGTAGDGIFTNNGIGTEGTVAGPRTVRVLAENLDSSGLLHATAVEVDGLTVVTQAPATPPLATTRPATAVTTTTATLGATVNPQGTAATVKFIFGTDSALASGTTTSGQEIGSGATAVSLTAALTGLTPGTTYYYQVVATSTAGTTHGSILNFTTTAAPTSSVNPLPATTTNTSFTVSWSGSPGPGATGITSYAIFISVDGGGFTPFLTHTIATSATFTGQFGHTYGFYSVATDNLGDVQATPSGAQATTTLVSPPAPPVIIGETAVFQRKTNKKGKPVGSPVLTGFVVDFSAPLNAATATNPVNYQLDTVTTKKVKKTVERILHPITKFTVSYSAANDSVDLALVGTQTFPTGGQLTIVSGPSRGVTGASGAPLGGPTVLAISAKGRTITLA